MPWRYALENLLDPVHGAFLHHESHTPYPPSAGPGGPFGIVGMVCPVDAGRSGVFVWRCRRVDDWQRATWRFLYRPSIEKRHWEVLDQDRVMLEAMPADADRQEDLYQHDLGVVRLRRLFRAAAEAQSSSKAQSSSGP